MIKNQRSIRTRLILWNITSLTVLLMLLGLVIHVVVSSKMYSSVDRELIQRTMPMGGPPPEARKDNRGRMDGGPNPRGPKGIDPNTPTIFIQPEKRRFDDLPKVLINPRPRPRFDLSEANPSTNRAIIFDLNGKSLMEEIKSGPVSKRGFDLAVKNVPNLVTAMVDGEPIRYYYKRIGDPFHGDAIIQAPYPLNEVRKALAELDRAMLLMIPLALICSMILGSFMTKSVLRPVRHLTHSAERIGGEDLSQRLPSDGSDEFAELAQAFNGLLTRLQKAFESQQALVEQQRRFTADASHELRTPLTVIKANTSLAMQGKPSLDIYRETIEEVDHAVDSMNRLVSNLLLLARADEQQLGQKAIDLSLSEVIQESINLSKQPDTAPISLESEQGEVIVHGNQDELVRLFANLIDNAQRYTPRDGSIRIMVDVIDSVVKVSIIDTGTGIASEHLPHLGERFYRVDASRTRHDGGTGLGLSICRGIIEAHGGSLNVDSELGKGTCVICTLPRVLV